MINKKMANELEIYNYCEKRWDYYEEIDGGYYPSKHDKKVFEDASKKFNLSVEEIDMTFNSVAKAKADIEIKGLSKTQMVEKFKEILENNKETPWGMNKK